MARAGAFAHLGQTLARSDSTCEAYVEQGGHDADRMAFEHRNEDGAALGMACLPLDGCQVQAGSCASSTTGGASISSSSSASASSGSGSGTAASGSSGASGDTGSGLSSSSGAGGVSAAAATTGTSGSEGATSSAPNGGDHGGGHGGCGSTSGAALVWPRLATGWAWRRRPRG